MQEIKLKLKLRPQGNGSFGFRIPTAYVKQNDMEALAEYEIIIKECREGAWSPQSAILKVALSA